MNIYVGGLAWTLSENELREAFAAYGEVTSATIIKDKFTGKSRGFGFVEMPDKDQGEAAIKAMNGKDLKGRVIKVNEAKPKSAEGYGREPRDKGF